MSVIDTLNPEQKEAARTIEGPLLVLAGAGTGKTRVITCRIAYMIEQGIDPASILGVTFTNKAAREMRERLNTLVPPALSKLVTLGTFHSFCARVLHRDIHLAGNYNSNFSISDDADQSSIVRQAAAELGYAKDEINSQEALAYIGRMKNQLKWPADALAEDGDSYSDRAGYARIYERYQQMLELQNTLDFDDMLLLTLKIFEEHPEALKHYQEIYRYLLVDEYQDTNMAQFRILRLLAGRNRNICVVGDDDQSIYSWRGAVVSNILDFPNYFPGAKEIKLEQNYRSTNTILNTANAIIAKNDKRYEKNLWSAKGHGEMVKVFRLRNGEAEAQFVADAIEDMIARNPDMCYSDFAILYRSNYLSRLFEQEFRRRGIRPKIIGGQEFFQRKEVKDAAAYLKLIVNPRDDQSLLRVLSVPPRGLGDKAILMLRDMQKQKHKPLLALLGSDEYLSSITKHAAASARAFTECISAFREIFSEKGSLAFHAQDYLDQIGYLHGLQKIYRDIKDAEKRKENILEFTNYMGSFEAARGGACTLGEFMESYSLMDDNDRTEDEDRDAPIMTTVHASKGLEFPCVFLVGMEHGLFPHERSLEENSGDEERRLFYVAITRAREYLFMTYCAERFKYHEYIRQRPSPFLNDLPEDYVEKPKLDEYFKTMSDEEIANAFADILKELRED